MCRDIIWFSNFEIGKVIKRVVLNVYRIDFVNEFSDCRAILIIVVVSLLNYF